MDARPGGPTAKREPSPGGLGINPQDDQSAVGAALNLGLSYANTKSIFLASGANGLTRKLRICPTLKPSGLAALLLGPPVQRAFNIELSADKSTRPSPVDASATAASAPVGHVPSMPSPSSTLATPCAISTMRPVTTLPGGCSLRYSSTLTVTRCFMLSRSCRFALST